MPGKLKISNEKSAFNTIETPAVSFDEQVRKAESDNREINAQTFKIANQIFEIFMDKKLPENKSPIEKATESRVIKELQDLSTHLNQLETQPFGAGSTAVEAILFGLLSKYRDRINILEHQLSELQKQFIKTKDQELA